MFVEHGAFDRVPGDAQVDSEVMDRVIARLLAPGDLTSKLDAGFRALEQRQPCIADFVANELSGIEEPGAQGVAYFLAIVLVQAFEEAFGSRLGPVEFSDLTDALDRLITDSELRSAGAAGQFYSEDALALGQPAIVSLLRSEIARAVDEAPARASKSVLDAYYESLLVIMVALTKAVAPRRR